MTLAALCGSLVAFSASVFPGQPTLRNVVSTLVGLSMLAAIGVVRKTGNPGLAVHLVSIAILSGYVSLFALTDDVYYLGFVVIVPVVAALFGGVRLGGFWIGVTVSAVILLTQFRGALFGPAVESYRRGSVLEGWTVALTVLGVGFAALWREGLAERARLRKLESERALVLEKERFGALARYAYDVVLEASLGDEIIEVGPGLFRTLGYTPEQIIGRKQQSFIHPDDLRRVDEGTKRTESGGMAFRVELRLRHADGSWVWTRSAGGTYTTPEGESRWIYALRDIDSEKETEQRLRDAQQLRSLGELAGGIAHDFNNLLTVIHGYAELLPEEPAALEIRDAAARASELTGQLLAFGRQQGLRSQVVNLNELVESSAGMIQSLVREDVTLDLCLDPKLPVVDVDPGSMHRALMNLATNARDAMPEGGRLRVVTQALAIGAQESSRLGLERGTYVVVEVEDEGIGMDSEVRRRAFEPFFTTKEFGSGSGLGLSSVLGVVEQSGGTVTLNSRVDRGTTVRIYLPVAALGAVPVDMVSGDPADEDVGSRLEILVVEDEPSVRRLVDLALAGAGHSVRSAANGAKAMEVLEAGHLPDLLVTDVVMPGMRGPELARRLRLRSPSLKVLFMSGYQDEELGDELGPRRNTGFIAKPFRPAELKAAVDALFETNGAESDEPRSLLIH